MILRNSKHRPGILLASAGLLACLAQLAGSTASAADTDAPRAAPSDATGIRRNTRHRPPPRRNRAGRADRDLGARRRRARSGRCLQRRQADPARADAAVLLDQPAQHGGQHPRSRRALRPHQRRHRAGRRHLHQQVYYSRIASATFDFLDVDRLEILRGPQGTLYGKNTTAGAINITTRAPSFDTEAQAEASTSSASCRRRARCGARWSATRSPEGSRSPTPGATARSATSPRAAT